MVWRLPNLWTTQARYNSEEGQMFILACMKLSRTREATLGVISAFRDTVLSLTTEPLSKFLWSKGAS